MALKSPEPKKPLEEPEPQLGAEPPQPDPAKAAAEAKKKGDEPAGQPAMDFIARSLNKPPAAPDLKAKKPGEPEPELDDDGNPKPAAPAPKKPAPRKKAPAPAAPALDGEALAAAIAKGVSEGNKPPPAPAAPKPEDNLSDADKRRVAAYKQMEAQFGDRYKGLADRYVGNLTKLKEYAANWEKEHEGEKFDEDDDEHAEFLQGLEAEVAYEDDDYIEAVTELKVAAKTAAPDNKTQERLDALERSEKLKKELPKAIEYRDKAGNKFWEKMGDQFKEVLTPEGQVNAEALKALNETDPDVHNAVVQAATAVEAYATETYLLDNGLVKFDPQNEIHSYLSRFAVEKEQAMMKRDPEKQLDAEGREFMPRAEYNKLSAKKRADRWTFTYEDIGFLIASDFAKHTQKLLAAEEEKFTRRAKAKGISLPNGLPQPKSPATTRQREELLDDDDEKPVSPGTPSAPLVAPPRGAKAAAPTTGLEGFVHRALRGS